MAVTKGENNACRMDDAIVWFADLQYGDRSRAGSNFYLKEKE